MRILLFVVFVISLVLSCQCECYFPGAEAIPIRAEPNCPLGYFCPNITESDPRTWPQVCTPFPSCQLTRLSNKFCTEQGTYEPVVCRPGKFCANWTVEEDCPSGHYCPVGSYEPKPCEWLAYCPEYSKFRVYYGGVVIILIIDVILGVIYFILKKRDQKALEKIPFVDEEKQGLIITSSEVLANGFEKGCKGKRMDLRFDNLTFTLPSGKTILSGVTGHIKPGRVTAVMGPSGAGKTTFLSVLMGKVNRTGGTLYINGESAEMFKFKKITGYVPQEDIMLRELTVRENIEFSARVRLPPTWTNEEIDSHVTSIIRALGLELVQHTQIGDEFTRGISGGQRKRVNIGMELAACPITLFLDEPTSGLDSTAALSVCKILKSIAGLGISVVAVIHQPRYEIFESFDDILILAPGGRTTYIGPQVGVVPYFESLGYQFPPRINPADVVMDIVAGKVINSSKFDFIDLPSRWESQQLESVVSSTYLDRRTGSINSSATASTTDTNGNGYTYGALRKESIHYGEESLYEISKSRGASFFRQIVLCHNRSLLQQYRKVLSYFLEVFVGCLAGFLIGVASLEIETNWYQGVLQGSFVLISPAPVEFVLTQMGLLIGMSVGIAGAPAGVLTFGEEKVVYWREAACGHNTLAYYSGKTLSTLFRFAMSALHFAAVFYFLSKPLLDFWSFYLIILMTFFGVYGLAAVVSMVVPRENAPLLAVISALIFATLCGYGPTITQAKDLYVAWLFDASYNRWGAEALFTSETEPFRHIFDVELSKDYWGYTLDRFFFDIGMMAIIGLVLRVLAYFLLISVQRSKQR